MTACFPAMQGCPGALNVEGPAAPDVSRASPAETTEETRLLQGWKVRSGLTVHSSTALGNTSLYTVLVPQSTGKVLPHEVCPVPGWRRSPPRLQRFMLQ